MTVNSIQACFRRALVQKCECAATIALLEEERGRLRADKAELLATLKMVVRPHRQFIDMVDDRATDDAHRVIAKHEGKP